MIYFTRLTGGRNLAAGGYIRSILSHNLWRRCDLSLTKRTRQDPNWNVPETRGAWRLGAILNSMARALFVIGVFSTLVHSVTIAFSAQRSSTDYGRKDEPGMQGYNPVN